MKYRLKYIDFMIFWKWSDCGVCFKIYNQGDYTCYKYGIDLQILFLSIYIDLIKIN